MSRYFSGNHPSLLNQLEAHFTRVRHSFSEHLNPQIELLGGGYGQGKDSVTGTHEAPVLFNDLDDFLSTATPGSSSIQKWIHRERAQGERNARSR
jgi:hypothetical protein